MLEVKSIIREKTILPKRFYVFVGNKEDTRVIFPIDEKYRDLLYLIISLHYIECQKPSENKLLLKTNFTSEFKGIKKDIEELYTLLTRKKIELVLQKKTTIGSQQTFDTDYQTGDIVLFSGGIDSLSGSIKMIKTDPSTILLNNPSSKALFGKIKKILNYNLFSNTYTYFINSKIKTDSRRSHISDTRGLLYIASGYALSKFTKSKKLYFCENGGQLLDVMLGSEVYVNSYATKNTNLRYIRLIDKVISKFEGGTFPIDYLFKKNTKSEIISKYINEELFGLSWSCYTLRHKKMCGSCWNCFITKMSAYNAGLKIHENHYEYNPLTQVVNKDRFLHYQNIIYDMLDFYAKVIKEDTKSLEILEFHDDYFDDPISLGTKFGLDIFYGVKTTLDNFKDRSGLGRKAEKLLEKIDNDQLIKRHEEVSSLSH